jgi:hypothetical protein
MRRFWGGIAIFLFGGILGTGFGVALGFFFFPYVFPPPPANEQLTEADFAPPAGLENPLPSPPSAANDPTLPQSPPAVAETPPAIPPAAGGSPKPAAAPVPVATGTFIHANRSDPVHWGRGRVSVYQRAVFLESDFEVGPGPAFHVYLVPKTPIRSSADMKDVMYVDLGRLRSFKGSQRYTIPAGVNLKDYPSVIIWCERFSVLISPADLAATAAAAR